MNDNKRWKLAKLWDWSMGSIRNMSCFSGFCGGICGVLVDFDHIIQVVFDTGSRPFHIYSFIVAIIIFCGCCAYLGGLCFKLVLKKDKDVNSR